MAAFLLTAKYSLRMSQIKEFIIVAAEVTETCPMTQFFWIFFLIYPISAQGPGEGGGAIYPGASGSKGPNN